jgi:hypothetical protein
MFLGVLVYEASKVALDRKAKRVEAYHLLVHFLCQRLTSFSAHLSFV